MTTLHKNIYWRNIQMKNYKSVLSSIKKKKNKKENIQLTFLGKGDSKKYKIKIILIKEEIN